MQESLDAPRSDTAGGSGYAPRRQYTLEQLGARYPFYLRGIDGSDSVPFDVRADEVVTGARLDLTYSYSPALLSDLSHINVLVNDVVAASLPVPREEAGRSQRRSIDLPAQLITGFNRLRLQLIGHYTLECEDPLHSSLWASVSNKSALTLEVRHVPLPDDLSMLPLPFFDQRDPRRLSLPMVFANDRGAASMESAGMVASWFGALAGYRGAEFPVHWDGDYPREGNAVVFSLGDASDAALPTNAVSGPTLAVTANPNDARGKLLWVIGRDAQELKRAAQALVTGGATLTGQVAVVGQLEQLKPRLPYDAPNWLRTDRPVKFGEIVPEQSLDVIGYNGAPARLPLRLPPDLFGWREKSVPVDLRYRYTPQPGQANSALLISADQQFLKSFPLPSVDQIKDESWLKKLGENELLPISAQFQVPLDRLLARSELEFRFMYDYIKEGQCRDIIVDNVRGRIDADSSIDLSRYPHFMPMPNLAAFGGSGFPFTRLADLSETAVVFSSRPAAQDVATYLALMGLFGESTGYPATHVSVAFGAAGLETAEKDLILIASGDQSWLADWAQYMPASLAGQNRRFGTSDQIFKTGSWVTPDPRQSQSPVRTDLVYASTGDSAFFAGFESPVTQGRSVVLIAGSQPQDQELAVSALLDRDSYGEQSLQGSLAVVREGQIRPLVAEYTYSIGKLGPWRSLEWQLVQYWPEAPPWLIWALAGVVVLILLATAWGIARRRKT
ncbi:cellulose biosynthesis cyclic di-GMP-binding regulatory protein BcsB [Pusillimonas sp.]|uniref:cellulose biosynthesis cyclic di-GMP-binding regulatory protein BcsB n=1 Tax=Pusillimonas sp. TaxID=3040095 RepID=UPI0029A5F8F9|nr:cellulose biosynthesis cyclic di-GMP-binding regulatory protein BcsB [Pusillimonas sp.]MDX3895522.1 cellulose biosynthesis cyclic di-GMP-binding regulatory protein BcsB [Pusillimonas sp.]